ncbi:hypothetical protein [Streptomyces syringium]|uniref:hypothetical protein n=1 Tax=Streptomyces syringium TaxID=76729 RepID=UPI0033D68E65
MQLRKDSPICQVDTWAAKTDLEAGGLENITQLAIGTSVAAAGLTSWIATERELETAAFLDELQQQRAAEGQPDVPTVRMLKKLLTGPPGMTQAAELMVMLFRDDEGAFYDLIVDLGEYAADLISMIVALGISSRGQVLEDLDEMLVEFFTR